MNEKYCKCPDCGNKQKKKVYKKDNSFNAKALEFLFKSMNAVAVLIVDCEKCGVCFEQDKYGTEK